MGARVGETRLVQHADSQLDGENSDGWTKDSAEGAIKNKTTSALAPSRRCSA